MAGRVSAGRAVRRDCPAGHRLALDDTGLLPRHQTDAVAGHDGEAGGYARSVLNG